MSIYELEIGWAETANERRYLHWELLACEQVLGVFLSVRDDVLAVLFDGDRRHFDEWAEALVPTAAPNTRKDHSNEDVLASSVRAGRCAWRHRRDRCPRGRRLRGHTA